MPAALLVAPLVVGLLGVVTPAHAGVCDDPLFLTIEAPPPVDDRHGVATGTGTYSGKSMVGGRFSLESTHSPDVWRTVLLAADTQDEWMPKRFGYELVENIDAEHMYLRFDIGFLANSVHVKRQIVVTSTSGMVGDRFRTCWRMTDPTPYLAQISHLVSPDIDWERTSTGWWEVTPTPSGGAIINYQWWAETGKIPNVVLRYGLSNTLPDLLDAFDERVASQSKGPR
ncbi:MAG: hypothetical protein Q8P18_08445 [Pseudomonadota bacterium]|nr:hypothetical protein [Pseudomonadota bacterium]